VADPATPATPECNCSQEYITGTLAILSLLGLIGIAGYCLLWQPAYWGPVESVTTFLCTVVSGVAGGRLALARPHHVPPPSSP